MAGDPAVGQHEGYGYRSDTALILANLADFAQHGALRYTRVMAAEPSVLLVLDLVGTFAFALNGALTAVRAAHLDIVGVITLGLITAVGGGIIRDILLGALPPATFVDWRYLVVAAGGGLLAFLFSAPLSRFASPIDVLDAAGLSLFAVTGAAKALELGVGPVQAVLLGAVTGVGAAPYGTC